ncbi:MAG: hypothetical protein JRI23_29525 [Deltaproteobacteria bacterium]|jgi:tetratricopeptide (TPR) repeat protein|nr:hypothetical protein [Deltaproteobacteria bacterium]MBW2536291.1 hypothetical protein [Deltaproteobacteria bacterium]
MGSRKSDLRRRWARRPLGSLRRGLLWLSLALALTAALGSLAVTDAGAQAKRRSPPAARTEAEQQAMKLLDEDKLVSARRVADEILEQQKTSMVAHYVKGRVLHQAEGALGRAIHHLGRAREIYEKRFATHPRPPGAPWEFHRQLLFTIQLVAGELEEYEYQLEILQYHDALYHPDLIAERAWPLLHLGRVDEARGWAQEAADSQDPQQRSLGLNTLCAIEGEAGKRKEYFDACKAALDNAKEQQRKASRKRKGEVDTEHQSTLAVHAFNAAVAARAALELEQAEALAIEGTRQLAFTPANPWRFLVRHRMAQGRMKEAIEALREMQRWRTRQPPNVRDQVRAETDATFATVLLLAAKTETALRSVDLALERPDRRGLVSSTTEQAMGAHALLRRALVRTHEELAAERASWFGRGDQLRTWAASLPRSLAVRADEERIIGALTDHDRLVATFRPYVRGGIEPVPTWLLGDLVDVLGPGVVAVAVREVRRTDQHPGVAAYCDAFEAEIALARGDEARAIRLGKSAVESLPKVEALLRARSAAVAAEAARQDGKPKLSASLLEQAIQIDPGVIRRMGGTIPVRIRAQKGSKTAGRAAELLARSPRLRVEKGGFEIRVEPVSGVLQACLRGPTGTLLSCALPIEDERPPDGGTEPSESQPSPPSKKKLTVTERAQRIVEGFHLRALAMPLGLSGTDLSSLDGSTTVAEQAVREQLRGVLEDLSEGGSGRD